MITALKSIWSAARGASTREEFEADLQPVGRTTGRGEVEFSRSGEGFARLEVELKGVGDGEAEIYVNGRRWRAVRVLSGRFEQAFDSTAGDNIPALALGDRIEIRQSGAVILAGVIRRD